MEKQKRSVFEAICIDKEGEEVRSVNTEDRYLFIMEIQDLLDALKRGAFEEIRIRVEEL